jgi:hypothetical protein
MLSLSSEPLKSRAIMGLDSPDSHVRQLQRLSLAGTCGHFTLGLAGGFPFGRDNGRVLLRDSPD